MKNTVELETKNITKEALAEAERMQKEEIVREISQFEQTLHSRSLIHPTLFLISIGSFQFGT